MTDKIWYCIMLNMLAVKLIAIMRLCLKTRICSEGSDKMTIPIRCPICKTRLMDAENKNVLKGTIVECVQEKHSYDYRVKCTGCKHIIGIRQIPNKSIA